MIFYFSGTGNSLWIARRIAEGTGDNICNIADIVNGDPCPDLSTAERIGFVVPVYFYGLPLIVEDFLKIAKIPFDRRIYFIYNYGTFPGKAFDDAERTFMRYGLRISSRYAVRMPENYVMLFTPPDDVTVKKILADAESLVDDIIISINSFGKDILPPSSAFKNVFGIIARPIYLYGRGTGRFYVKSICTHCGKCAKMCPSKAIEMADNIPTWTKSKCYRCNACINRCPHQAIEFGHSTKNKRRYSNPDIYSQ